MRRTMVGMLAAGGLLLSACGSGSSFQNRPRPPVPVNLTVYINNARVSVSPSSVGAGPVVFIVTNAAAQTESLMIQSNGGESLANTGPINPQATAQVTVDFQSPGEYTVGTGRSGSDAFLANKPAIAPAKIHIGHPRPSASNQLLQP
jgi:hypothetical protein